MRYFFYRLLKALFILFIFFGLFIALLPSLASTAWGRKQVINWINHSIPGNLEIQALNLQWGKGQLIEGVLLKDPEGQSVLGIEKITTEATLWQLLRKSTHLGFTQLQELNAAIVTDEKGWTNLQRALGIPPSNDIPPLSPSTIVLSDVNADLYLFVEQHPLSAHVKGLTRQENLNGSFEINLSFNGLQSSNWSNLKEEAENYLSIEGSEEAQLQVRIVNFPVDLMDRLIALKSSHLNGFFHSILGDRLTLTMDKEKSHEGLAFHLTALAPLMQGQVKGKIVQGLLTLPEPAIFHFNLTPKFINSFTQHQFELLNFSRLNMVISKLSLPLQFLDSEASIDPCLLELKSEWSLSETKIDISPIGHLNILKLDAYLNSSLCDKTINLQIIGKGEQSQDSFDIELHSHLNKSRNFWHLLEQIRERFHGSLTISHLPLQLIPSLKIYPEWIEQIGPYANIELALNSVMTNEWEAILSLQTSHCTLKEALFRIGKEVVLKSPAEMNWTGKKDSLSSLLKRNEWTLEHPCSLKLTLNELRLPLQNPQFARYQLEFFIPFLQFPTSWPQKAIKIQDLTLKINGQKLNQFNSQLEGQLALLNQEGMNTFLTKEPFNFTQVSDWNIKPDYKIEMLNGHLRLNNSITHLLIEGRVHSNYQLELTQPVHIQYSLTPSAMNELSHLLVKKWPELQENALFKMRIEPTFLYLNDLKLSNLSLQGKLAIDHLALQDHSEAFTLKDVMIPWVIDGSLNNFYANLKGLAFSGKNNVPSHLSAHFQLWPKPEYPDFAHTSAEIRMNFAGMPTSIFNILLKFDNLSSIIGPVMDLNFKAFYDPNIEQPGYWDLQLDSALFHLDGRFKLSHIATLYDSNKPANIRLTLTPEGYQSLKKIFSIDSERKILSPILFSGILSDFYFPLRESSLDQGKFDLQLSTTDIQWQDQALPSIHLKGRMSSQNLLKHIDFNTEILSSFPLLDIQGRLINLFDEEKNIRSKEEIGIEGHLKGQQLTPALFQNLFLLNLDQTEKLKALFGDVFEIKTNFQLKNLNGFLEASARGERGELHLEGQIQEGVLKLNQPLTGSFKMSPLLSKAFLMKNIPILGTAVDAENSLTVKIDPSHFLCPLFPFKLNQVKIGKGTLDLGKVRFRNEGELSSFLSFIRSISDPYVTIWFTPLYFQLDHGLLTLQRLDMLINNSYTLASWGTIDLNRSQADLVVGLSAQSLDYAFGIQGLDEHDLLPVPLSSANGKVEVDKKKATAHISSLVAQTKGGSTGKLLGNLLDFALSSHKDEMSIPPPTTQPFPWKSEFNSSNLQTPKESEADTSTIEDGNGKKKNKRKRHHDQDSESISHKKVKKLQESAGQFIDQLFK